MILYGHEIDSLVFISDHIPEAMRELSSIKDHRDLVIAASFALIMAHRKARIIGNWLCFYHTYITYALCNH